MGIFKGDKTPNSRLLGLPALLPPERPAYFYPNGSITSKPHRENYGGRAFLRAPFLLPRLCHGGDFVLLSVWPTRSFSFCVSGKGRRPAPRAWPDQSAHRCFARTVINFGRPPQESLSSRTARAKEPLERASGTQSVGLVVFSDVPEPSVAFPRCRRVASPLSLSTPGLSFPPSISAPLLRILLQTAVIVACSALQPSSMRKISPSPHFRLRYFQTLQ